MLAEDDSSLRRARKKLATYPLSLTPNVFCWFAYVRETQFPKHTPSMFLSLPLSIQFGQLTDTSAPKAMCIQDNGSTFCTSGPSVCAKNSHYGDGN